MATERCDQVPQTEVLQWNSHLLATTKNADLTLKEFSQGIWGPMSSRFSNREQKAIRAQSSRRTAENDTRVTLGNEPERSNQHPAGG
jgi:hypothetical protein